MDCSGLNDGGERWWVSGSGLNDGGEGWWVSGGG